MIPTTPFSRQLRHAMTPAERIVWSIVRMNRLGHKFRRQSPRGPYVLDFVCLEKRLVLEIDGSQHADRAPDDVRRDAWLAEHGFRVMRFWNVEVLRNAEGVRLAIVAALEAGPS